ncbi:Ribosomal protein L11 methyltransferase [Desulfamplus magnetovallimortis]|uniref:Ribosomal protein L11 methyltransferase n=1 Tax=Desulfamplus magnetovallimortis TaxID=1246637 RepID=A0A1W1HIZ2_9BACT|nr:50S ribosomal protein L11 methyltransferase [Desulfamplus magnetovallimortis]SLM32328.1 Ribosomal protein L11 methyltransferase [Desulfamplus magnetovallimortis]
MKWIHVKAIFESNDIPLAEELVSDIFFGLGLQGVVCQIPMDAPPEGFASDAVEVSDETYVSGYLPDSDTSMEIIEKIREKAEELQSKSEGLQSQSGLYINIVIKTEIVDQEDWAEAWKSFFYVTRITEHIVVKPEWRTFAPHQKDIVIEIDPGMAFGTGTHPTTAMCVALIEKYLMPADTFLDVGTGSGILMIAGAKLGARRLCGIDNDEVAVEVACQNLEKNAIDPDRYHVEKNTLDIYLAENQPPPKFDIVTANIISEVIIEILGDIKKSLSDGGTVILSGIIREKEGIVLAALEEYGFSIAEIRYEGEWVAIAAKL